MADSKEDVRTTVKHPKHLQPYHKHKHQRATKLLIQLFTESRGGWFIHAQGCQHLKRGLDKINERIRIMNGERGEDEDLGVIDYNTIAYGWDYTRLKIKPSADIEQWQRQKLVQFCKRRQYPMGWSKIPPIHDFTYEPHEPAHWEKEWDVFEPWLKLIWLMRKRKFEKKTIEDMEMAMLEQKTKFNNTLRIKNERFGILANSFTHSLDFTTLLDVLQSMHECLLERQEVDSFQHLEFESRQYETKREILGQICELSGYPQAWIPADFEVESAT